MSGFDLSVSDAFSQASWYLSGVSVPFPKDEEREVKYRAVHGLKTFSDIYDALPLMGFKSDGASFSPDSSVFRLSPEFFYKGYTLANFGKDTVGYDGTPRFDIHANGYQLRQRFSVRPYLSETDPYAFGVSQCSVKDLYSTTHSINRVEIEKVMPGMGESTGHFFNDGDVLGRLPGFFSGIDAGSLRVYSGYLLARGSYLIGVYVPDEKAIVAYEISNDETQSVTPFLELCGARGYEWEAEAKSIAFMRSSGVVRLPDKKAIDRIFHKSAGILEEHLRAAHTGHIVPQVDSKLERSMRDVDAHYRDLSCAFNTAAAHSPDGMHGASYALGMNQRMRDIAGERGRQVLRELAHQMTPAYDFVNAPHAHKHMFDPRGSDAVFHTVAKGKDTLRLSHA